jgi:Zn-dependent protease/predicted transcriptional regulator
MFAGFGRNWRLGQVQGIEIRLDSSVLIIGVFIVLILSGSWFPLFAPNTRPWLQFSMAILTTILFIGSIIWHELAHSVMALRYRLPVVQIVIHAFGGVAQIGREPERPAHEFWITVAGPLSSALLALFFFLMSGVGGILGVACLWLGQINLVLAIFNLIPAFPLDGGRILRAALWRSLGSYRRATYYAARGGQIFAILFGLWGALIFLRSTLNGVLLMLMGWFIFQAAAQILRVTDNGTPISTATPLRRLMRVNVPASAPETHLALFAWQYMDHASDQAFPVLQDGTLVGMVTANEVHHIPRTEWGQYRLWQVMIPREKLVVLSPDDDLKLAIAKMDQAGLDHAPVLFGGVLVGMVNRRDIVYQT